MSPNSEQHPETTPDIDAVRQDFFGHGQVTEIGHAGRSLRNDLREIWMYRDLLTLLIRRDRLLRQLTESPDLSQRDLAQRLGLSLGKTNYCLRALIDKGWVKVNNFRNSQNKLAYAYVRTPSGMHAKGMATSAFLRRKQEEFADLEREIAQLRDEVRAGAEPGLAPKR